VTCAEAREVAPDIALGLVSGNERSDVLAHLDRCPGCRAYVDGLARTADALLLVAPEAEPPEGFETRALRGVPPAAAAANAAAVPRGPSRRTAIAGWVAAAACLVALLVAVSVDRGDDELVHAEMRTARGLVVGEAYLYGGDHDSWVFLSMPEWEQWLDDSGIEPSTYELVVELDDGTTTRVDIGTLTGIEQTWGGRVDLPVERALRVSVVDGSGAELCSAQL
jgi:hypothetical protein